jgi:hypothetical protein
MSSKLPRRSGLPAARPAPRERHTGTTYVYEIRAERKAGGIAAAVLGVLLLAAILGFVILGALTITLALWLACGLLLLSVIAAFFRRILGIGRRPAPGSDPR